MLSVVMLSVIIIIVKVLCVVILSVIMVKAVAPKLSHVDERPFIQLISIENNLLCKHPKH
jgi:hypothetical protein